jgi:uncharacterized protein with FMN-binding domain
VKRKIKIIAVAAVAVITIGIGGFAAVDRGAKSATKDIVVYTQSATGILDGVYTGSYEIPHVKVAVQVSVKDEKITDISILEHQTLLGGKAERIVDDVIERQSLNIDAVSGATVSSKTILKAIENALSGGIE